MKISFSFLSGAFFILFSAGKLSAQNLVPNSSFEDYDVCPDGCSCPIDQLHHAIGWSSFSPSADYFNSCNNNGVGVPINTLGTQAAASGSAYCGLYTYYGSEIFGRELSSPLIIGNKYFASIKVSFADSFILATNDLGIAFSTVQFFGDSSNQFYWAPLNGQAKVFSNSIISENNSWVIISGCFISDSTYKYIMIGNFFNPESTDTMSVNYPTSFYYGGYYFIDDVCVSPDSLECDLNPEGIYNLQQQQITIYPNPATEQLIIDNARLPVGQGQLIIKGIEIFDLVGRKMMDDEMGNALLVKTPTTSSNHYTINTKNFPSGYYFIRINTSEGIINRKIVLQ